MIRFYHQRQKIELRKNEGRLYFDKNLYNGRLRYTVQRKDVAHSLKTNGYLPFRIEYFGDRPFDEALVFRWGKKITFGCQAFSLRHSAIIRKWARGAK